VSESSIEQADFPNETASVRAARRFVTDAAAADGLDVDHLELLVSELAANAVLHGRTSFTVALRVLDHHVRVSVSDQNPQAPVVQPDQPRAVTGRGMRLVDSLSSRWGVEPAPPGKTVWFELPLSAEA